MVVAAYLIEWVDTLICDATGNDVGAMETRFLTWGRATLVDCLLVACLYVVQVCVVHVIVCGCAFAVCTLSLLVRASHTRRH